MSTAGEPDALAVGDPRGHLHLERARARVAPPAAALAAGLLGHATVAVADVADHRAHHLPERRTRHRLQLSGAAAALAGLDRRSRLGAVAVAVLTALDRLEGDLHLRAVGSLDQVDLDRDRDVGARRRPGASADAPPPKNASNRSPIEPNASKLGAYPPDLESLVAVAVVGRASLGVGQDLVGLGRLLELLLGVGVVRVDVGVQLSGQLAKGLLDLLPPRRRARRRAPRRGRAAWTSCSWTVSLGTLKHD